MLAIWGKHCLSLLGPFDSHIFQAEEYFWILLKTLGNLDCAYMENTFVLLYIHMENKKITYLILLWCYLNNIVRSPWTFMWESLLQIHINTTFQKNPQKQKTCHNLFFACMLAKPPWQEPAGQRGGAGLAGGGRAALAEAAEVTPGCAVARAALPGRSSCSSTGYTPAYLHSLLLLCLFFTDTNPPNFSPFLFSKKYRSWLHHHQIPQRLAMYD